MSLDISKYKIKAVVEVGFWSNFYIESNSISDRLYIEENFKRFKNIKVYQIICGNFCDNVRQKLFHKFEEGLMELSPHQYEVWDIIDEIINNIKIHEEGKIVIEYFVDDDLNIYSEYKDGLTSIKYNLLITINGVDVNKSELKEILSI